MAHYLDTSAAVKLVVREPHSEALRDWLDGLNVVGSDLLRTELLRAAHRHSPEALAQARLVLQALPSIALTPSVCDLAAELDPAIPPSLDALHLACAVHLGDELDGVLTYDDRMASACTTLGVPAISPGIA